MPALAADGLWPAQERAIRCLELSLAADRPRSLIQMATGAGKTFTACTFSHRLLEHGKFKRILFLADRANLVRQARDKFSAYRPPGTGRSFTELYNVQRLGAAGVDKSASVVISTIQRVYSVLTGRELSEEQEQELRKKAKSIVLKGVRSPERLLDETALFLHRVIADLPPSKQKMIERLHESDEPLRDRKVLVVDDDIRNIFALNSLLERHHMQVISATNGQDAIKAIEATDDLSLVLMDIMMPEMDGYETMWRIRTVPKYRVLPIIALTAKAMKGDREKCLEAGASDYVAKPVDTGQLLSLVRTWLHR